MPSATTQLLVIDPQNDFCDLPEDWRPGGQRPSLPVAGAHADMQRLGGWIRREGAKVDAITVTLDSHQRYDIAHPAFWQHGDGGDVAPFTAITAAQVRAGVFRPRNAEALQRSLDYLDALEANSRYTLMVWPVHCEVGSWGHGIHADVLAACGDWQQQRQRALYNVFKGLNPWTEHYSALLAEVPDPADPATLLNTALLERLGQADILVVAGEASSHCVRSTVEHLVEHLPHPERIVLMHDAMSPVPGFESAHHDFLAAMQARGLRLASSQELYL
ncbi:isochorismatase family protein [Delftia acidovorans]|uniref:cysteine hydrolase n=1 Tax=Delftia acidovorans TaxID=80866 RepID=UPI000502937E|nr:cysteine hydrolase [Delftia acidovorans]KFJ14079.1 isochorismatase family protein [Delftia acidovorans]QQB49321.1 cysteine hydrolase [Delftia acidovorans]